MVSLSSDKKQSNIKKKPIFLLQFNLKSITKTSEKTPMFRDYKEIFKDFRKIQDKLWKDSTDRFPVSALPLAVGKWEQDTFSTVNKLVDQAINQSLDLQREWLSQWTERASGKALKPKTFAELSADAQRSTERWLKNQNQLWDQWLELLSGANSRSDMPDFAEWEKAVEESMQAQMKLVKDWSEMTKFKKLSGKEFSRLSNHIAKAMDKSITTQQQLWNQWFDYLGEASETGAEPAAKPAPAKKQAKKQAKAKPATSGNKSNFAADDLKKINGIGPGLEKKLKEGGVKTLHELAELNDSDIARLEDEVIRFSGRIKRDKWVEQAKKLIK